MLLGLEVGAALRAGEVDGAGRLPLPDELLGFETRPAPLDDG